MTLSIDGKPWRLWFVHEDAPIPMGPGAGQRFPLSTTCYLQEDGPADVAFRGTFYIPRDNNGKLSRDTWRKIALCRVLKNAEFEKPARRQVWQAYLSRKLDKGQASVLVLNGKREALRLAIKEAYDATQLIGRTPMCVERTANG